MKYLPLLGQIVAQIVGLHPQYGPMPEQDLHDADFLPCNFLI
jgi:hypothetical protein